MEYCQKILSMVPSPTFPFILGSLPFSYSVDFSLYDLIIDSVKTDPLPRKATSLVFQKLKCNLTTGV